MLIKVNIPGILRHLSKGESQIQVSIASYPVPVRHVLDSLDNLCPGINAKVHDLKKSVNIFVAEEDIRFLEGLDTHVINGQTVDIVPAIAGG